METYNGHVRTPADAIILFEACRLGLLPRVQRRLSEKERQSIKSGSVFVWDEREAGMRRWTDGKSWSASRVSGSFLTYREMEGKRGGSGFAQLGVARAGKTPDSTRGSDSDLEGAGDDGPDGYRYKPDGLMKQSFSITTSAANHLHLISYYARSHPNVPGLNHPTSDPALRHIRPQKGMYPESTVQEQQNIPAVTRSPMLGALYSTVPQMAGYARSGPPHPLSYAQQPGYNWPSTPPPIPPIHGSYYQYGPNNSLPPPPPGINGHSPLSYSQSAPPETQTSVSSVYDRAPSSHPDNLPHPPPPTHHHRSSNSNNGMGQYMGNPAPRGPQSVLYAQQQAAQAQDPSSTPPMSKIDPQLMTPLPLNQQRPPQNSIHSRSPSPLPAKQERFDPGLMRENGTSQASNFPSIGALMNGSSADNTDAKSDQSGRSGSRSPGGTQKKDGPKDIPNEKLGFGEDMRALRVLDRAFKT
ncbi:hypothetical protein MMC12_002853 [Toensbergia leucococca]|nr:hypothetical protein [Toensbergia leucococca]